MEQINPRETVPLVWRNPFPNDGTTYYVQAKIYNSLTRVLLDTVNLTSGADGVFYGSFVAPGDSSGMGLKIDINIDVYTDSGYTIHSENHSQENTKYLVQTRVNAFRTGFGGGGSDVDYKRIQKMLDEAIAAVKPTDYAEKLAEIYKCVESIKVETEGVKDIARADKTSSISKKLDEISKSISLLGENVGKEILESIGAFGNLQEQILTGFENLTNTVSEIPKTENIERKIDSLDAKISSIPQIVESIPDKVDEMKQGLGAMANALAQVETMTIHKGLSIPEIKPEKLKEQTPAQKDFSMIAKLLSQ